MGVLAAIQLLTRVPVRPRREPSLRTAVPWFPVVGAVIGAVVGGTAAALWHATTPLVAAAVAVVLGVLLTGAFHEDGLADVADAFAGGWTRDRRLEILKDPRHGSYGVAAMCSSIVVRVACLASLPGPATMFASAIAAHATGRTAAVAALGTGRAADPGLGADYTRATSRPGAAVGVAAGLAITAVATGWWVGPFAAVGVFAAVTVGWLAVRAIGGINGDTLGAIEQVAECLCLVVATMLARHTSVWFSS